MGIKEALAPTGKAKMDGVGSLYVKVNEKGLLYWFHNELDIELVPVSLLHILKNEWLQHSAL